VQPQYSNIVDKYAKAARASPWVLTLWLGIMFPVFTACQGPRTPSPAHEFTQPVLSSSGTIGLGGSLSNALRETGISSLDAFQIERSLKPVFNIRHAKSQHHFEILRSTSGVFLEMKYWPDEFSYFEVVRSSQAVFSATRVEIPTRTSWVAVSGQVQSSLWESMRGEGVPPEMIYKFADIFGWRIDFLTEPRAGDRFRMLWTRDSQPLASRDGDILAASYENRGRSEIMAFKLGDDYFDRQGQSMRGEFLRAPLAYRRISSGFTNRRFHPILRYYRPHHGTDYSAPYGTPVQSIGDGRVISAGYDQGIGNAVRIRHAGSYISIYGHLRGFAKGIHSGVSVHQGQTVGYVGSTGLSTGPHLHFGFETGGQLVNFLTFKFSSKVKSVALAQKETFTQLKRQMLQILSQLPANSQHVLVIKETP
jgi:murein DD-endopeptidase MepM/ murein hydrolase activator NlpD